MLALIKQIGWLGLVAGLLCGTAAWLLARLPMAGGLEEWLHDGCFFARGVRATQTRTIVVGLDDASLKELTGPLLYISPQLAEVVAYLHAHKAAAVGIDLLIPQDFFGRDEFKEGGQGDATRLGTAIFEAGNVVLAEKQLAGSWLEPLPQWRLKEFADPDPARIDLGFVNVSEDDDTVVRRQVMRTQGHTHFSLALYARAHNEAVVWDDGRLSVGGRPIPLDGAGKLRINFVGPPGTCATVSFRDVLAAARNRRAAPMDFAGAIVVVGITAPSQGDLHATPYANTYWRSAAAPDTGLMPGPELHANIIATIGDGAYIATAPALSLLPSLLVIGGVLGVAFEGLNRIKGNLLFLLGGPPLAFLLCLAWSHVVSAAFQYANLRLAVVPMFLVVCLAYFGNFPVRWLALQRIAAAIQSTEARLHALRQSAPDLAGDLQALAAMPDVPSTLNRIRSINEKIVGILCERAALATDPSVYKMVENLEKRGLLSKSAAIHARTIQANTSPGSHYQKDPLSKAHVAIAQKALVELLAWYGPAAK